MLHAFFVILHVLICIALTTVILLQSSKGGGLAGAFGGAGGAPQQLLGSRGMTTLLHKMTIYLAVSFFMTSFILFMTQGTGGGTAKSVISDAARKGQLNLPVQESPLPGDLSTTPQGTEGAGGQSDQQGGQSQDTGSQGGGGSQ